MNPSSTGLRRSSTHYFGADSWQTSYDACLRLHREIATSLADRNRLPRTAHAYVNLNESILQNLKSLGRQIEALKRDLNLATEKSLTSRERARREGLVEDLMRSEQDLRFSMSQSHVSTDQLIKEKQRKELLSSDGGGVADLGDIQWGSSTKISNYGAINETSGANPIDSSTYGFSTQPNVKQALEEQDRGLDILHGTVIRTRGIAENIETEVGVHNDIIDGLDDDIERTNQHLLSTNQRVTGVNMRMGGVWKYWLVIALLLVVIVVIIVIP